MSETLTVRIAAKQEELSTISSVVQDLGKRESWSESLVYKIDLVLEELCLNIMNYGFSDEGREGKAIEITFVSEDGSLKIDILDEGRPFDPIEDSPDPDVDSDVEDRAVGGLGIFLVKTIMDEMHYRREQGRNHLSLVAHNPE